MITIAWWLFALLALGALFGIAGTVAVLAHAEHVAQRIVDRILGREFGPRPTAWIGDLMEPEDSK